MIAADEGNKYVMGADDCRSSAHLRWDSLAANAPPGHVTSHLSQILTMDAFGPPRERRYVVLDSLEAAIKSLDLARDVTNIAPAKAAFGSVSVLLTTIVVGLFLLSCVDRLQAKMYPGLNLGLNVHSRFLSA